MQLSASKFGDTSKQVFQSVKSTAIKIKEEAIRIWHDIKYKFRVLIDKFRVLRRSDQVIVTATTIASVATFYSIFSMLGFGIIGAIFGLAYSLMIGMFIYFSFQILVELYESI